MHELQELVDVVTRNKVKSIRLLEPFGDQPPDMLHDFYARLANHQFANDEEAAQFYGYISASDRGYRKQRDKLRERLYNSAVFIDVNSPKFNDAQKAFYTCQKNLVVARILLGRNARYSAIELIKRTVQISLKYEFSELSLEFTRLLRSHHAMKTGIHKSYLQYNHDVEKYEKIVYAENRVRYYYDRISLELRYRSNVSEEYLNLASEALNEFSKIETDTYRFILFSSIIRSDYLIAIHKYREAITEAGVAIQRLSKKKTVADQFLAKLQLIRLLSFICLEEYNEGERAFKNCSTMLDEGSVDWFNTYEVYFILLTRTKSYMRAFKTFRLITSHSLFNYVLDARRETWRTYEAYLYLLIINDRLQSNKAGVLLDFKPAKFINEVPHFSMDKSGYYIPILIVQHLLLIIKREELELLGQMEALNKYAQRHVKKEDNFRSHYFMKMLLLVPKFNFDRDVIKTKAKPYLKKLESVPLSEAKQSFEIEIIPYETLWEYVLESLED